MGQRMPDDAIGVSHALAGVAESGTLVLASGADNPTTLNFLPETHVVVLAAEDVVGDYETVFAMLRKRYGKAALPRTVNMITGPSRSGDIEQTILLGAHGPRRLHIVIIGRAKPARRSAALIPPSRFQIRILRAQQAVASRANTSTVPGETPPPPLWGGRISPICACKSVLEIRERGTSLRRPYPSQVSLGSLSLAKRNYLPHKGGEGDFTCALSAKRAKPHPARRTSPAGRRTKSGPNSRIWIGPWATGLPAGSSEDDHSVWNCSQPPW